MNSNYFNNRAEEHVDKDTDMACYIMLKAIYYKLCEIKDGNKRI